MLISRRAFNYLSDLDQVIGHLVFNDSAPSARAGSLLSNMWLHYIWDVLSDSDYKMQLKVLLPCK